MRGSRRLRTLERRYQRKHREHQGADELEEYKRFAMKYGDLPEYWEMMDAIDDLLTDLDGKDIKDPYAPIPGSEPAAAAMDAFTERCRELEREESNGST